MKEKENKINLLKQEVKLLKNRLNGPTVNYDLLVENAEEQENNCKTTDEKLILWMKTYEEALEIVNFDMADCESDGELF